MPIQHQYVVLETGQTAKLGVDEFPVTRDPERSFYMRREGEGLLVGFFESPALPWAVDGIPYDFGQQLLSPNFGHIEASFASAVERVPALEGLGMARIVNGPDAYTPDGKCIMGEVPGLRGFHVLAGFSCFGIVFSGGAGRHAAEWIVDGRPSEDMWELDVRRFGSYAAVRRHLVAKACETYEREYAVHYPHEERPAGRPLKTSAIYDRLQARGAVYGARFGWERPLWFAPPGVEPADTYTFRHPSWYEYVGRECRAVRERVGLLDQTSFGKIKVSGPASEAFLDRLCANRMPSQKGKVVVTQMLNEYGGIECDLTVTRLEEDVFLIITAAATTEHDLDWIRRNISGGSDVSVRDVTAEYGCLTLSGPAAREVLARASDDDVSNAGFPYMTMKRIHIGSAPVSAIRISYVGELGWELYHPIEMQRHLYETLVEAGCESGIVDYGYRALDSLRMEKGYRLWGFDMTGQDTPYEAGLGRFVCLDKGDFTGRDALLKQRGTGISRSLACLTLDDPPAIPHGWEPIVLNGEVLGHVTSGEYGHCVQKAIFMAYLPPQYAGQGTRLEVEVLGELLPTTVVKMPLVDPGNEKPRQ